MSAETKALLKSIYHTLLTTGSIAEARVAVAAMMEAEDMAYVEKLIKEFEKEKNK